MKTDSADFGVTLVLNMCIVPILFVSSISCPVARRQCPAGMAWGRQGGRRVQA
jgi:hypothetical protein